LLPSSGLCLNVLSTAARHGDAHLATDVFRVLTNRNTVFDHQHYEMLLEAYINAGDIKTALSVLIIMQDAGVKPDEGTASPILRYLQQDPERPMEAFTVLQNLEQAGCKIPTAAVNCTIQAAIAVEDLGQAIEFYKVLHTISHAGPNTATFNILLRGCSKMGRKELAMFLAAEMIELKVPPDAITYDRLILVCLNGPDIEDAFQYYEEMRDQGFAPRRGTFTSLVKVCTQAGDSRAQEIIEDMRHLGMDVAKLEIWMDTQKRSHSSGIGESGEKNRTPGAFDIASAEWPSGAMQSQHVL
jgi:pentatricopeptide repeat protein